MDLTAFVFPGQGSQRLGMGRDLVNRYPDLLDRYYRPADGLLGVPLSRLCWEGPTSALRHMAITQPAVLLTSLCMLDVLRAHGAVPDMVAGHSLGEYTALVAAGVLEWESALQLVRRRGELMASVNDEVAGTMVAVVGLRPDAVERLCARAYEETGEVVQLANHNDRTQVVVSGQTAAVARLMELLTVEDVERVVTLEVGGPAHCSLMERIEDAFVAELARVCFHEPRLPVVSGVTARPLGSAEEARECLRQQLTRRVRWVEAVDWMTAAGATCFVEVGPGKVLSRLCARLSPRARTFRTGELSQLLKAARALSHRSDLAGRAG